MGFNEKLWADTRRNTEDIGNVTSTIWSDFLTANITPWSSTAVNAGTTSGAVAGLSKHAGIRTLTSSTNANSGFSFVLSNNSILLIGGEKSTHIFKTSSTLLGVTRRMGFHDCTSVSDAVDGVYGEIIDGVLVGKTSNDSTRSTTGTSKTLLADTWYKLTVELNADASLATFTLYEDDSNNIIWTDSLATNIPKTTGRETNHGDIATYSGTSAIIIGYVDYMDMILPNVRGASSPVSRYVTQQVSILSPLKNKKWAILGDSISDNVDNPTISHYYENIKTETNCLIYEHAHSGTGYITTGAGFENMADRVAQVELDSDYITIFAGTNDVLQTLGTLGDTTVATMYGAIDLAINNLITRFPNKKIAVLTPLPRKTYRTVGNALELIAKAIREVCARYSIPCLDLYSLSGLRPWNDTNNLTYFSHTWAPTGDGIHPNSLGHEWVTPVIKEFMEKL